MHGDDVSRCIRCRCNWVGEVCIGWIAGRGYSLSDGAAEVARDAEFSRGKSRKCGVVSQSVSQSVSHLSHACNA
jgi:hypothetical protein